MTSQNALDQQSDQDPTGYNPNDTEESQKIGKHPLSQARKLLDKPIAIPRNPWALIVDITIVILLVDFCAALGIVAVSLPAATSNGAVSGQFIGGVQLFIALLLIIKTIVMVAVVIRMAVKWVPDSYELTERQLIKTGDIVGNSENVYELENIRQVSVKEGYIGKHLKYGDVVLLIATAGLNKTIVLRDVKDPHHFKEVFKGYLG